MPGNYSLRFKRDAERELRRLPKADIQRLLDRIHRLATAPRPPGCKKLGEPSIYRMRQGDYRVIYAIDDTQRIVEVLRIAHRREVYR